MKRILVIDDDEYSAEVAAAHLTGAGYAVSVAHDGFTGLKQILQDQPDLLLTDIWMPVGTGLSLAQRLGELEVNHLPIIFMTASRHEGLRDSAAQLGVVAYFEKPYDSKQLLGAVRLALAGELTAHNTRLPSRLHPGIAFRHAGPASQSKPPHPPA